VARSVPGNLPLNNCIPQHRSDTLACLPCRCLPPPPCAISFPVFPCHDARQTVCFTRYTTNLAVLLAMVHAGHQSPHDYMNFEVQSVDAELHHTTLESAAPREHTVSQPPFSPKSSRYKTHFSHSYCLKPYQHGGAKVCLFAPPPPHPICSCCREDLYLEVSRYVWGPASRQLHAALSWPLLFLVGAPRPSCCNTSRSVARTLPGNYWLMLRCSSHDLRAASHCTASYFHARLQGVLVFG